MRTVRGEDPLRRACRTAAFTLIEVLVVVAIIALLVSILIPSLSRAREQARRVNCASNLHQVATAIMNYAQAAKGKLPHFENDPNTAELIREPYYNRFFHLDRTKQPELDPHYFTNLGHVWRGRLIREGKLLYCPSEKDPLYTHDSYAPFPRRNDLNVPGHEYIRISYNYNPHVKIQNDPREKFKSLKDFQRLYPNYDEMPPGRTLLVDLLSGGSEAFAHVSGQTGGWNIVTPNGSVHFKQGSTRLFTILPAINNSYKLYLQTIEFMERGLLAARGETLPRDVQGL